MKYLVKKPDTGYINTDLLIPKSAINEAVVTAALTFAIGDEEYVIDNATGEVLGTRQKTIELWDETNSHFIVPREFLNREQRERFNCSFIKEPYPPFPRVDIEDRITLRDEEQEEAFNALLNNNSGTLNLSCGKGKTVIALKLAATLKVPTIVIINSTALLEQWKEEIHRHLGVKKVGVIQGKTSVWEDCAIVLAMVHTLSGRDWTQEFKNRFGLVLYDEGHHMSAPIFMKSANLFHGKRYSLTATADRTDGLEAIYQYHLGGVIHKNLSQALIPETIFHQLKWQLKECDKKHVTDRSRELNMSKIRSFLGKLSWRDRVICEKIQEDLNNKRSLLVLSHTVAHVENLFSNFAAIGAGIITGKTPQNERMQILKTCNPVFGTFQLAREGLNKPSLDTLYITTPFSNSNDLQQSWGRIQRRYEDKKDPIVRVFEDTGLSYCKKSCNRLRQVLRGMNYNFRKEVSYVE